MSRYATLTPTAHAVLALIRPHSSMRPISQGDIGAQARTIAPPDEIHDALEQLIDARLITHMRHTVGDVMQNVYWPTGLQPLSAPSLEEIRMASEPKNSQLAALIVKHGPLSGSDLAAKAQDKGLNCPTKNVQGILGGHLTRGEIVLKKRGGLNWYMTPNQAAEWDGKTEGPADIDATAEAGAHVMSAPAAMAAPAAIAKQSEGEIPELSEARRTIETLRDNITGMLSDWTDIRQALDVETHEEALLAISLRDEWIAKRDRTIHDLKNDVCAANLIFSQIAETLKVERPEQIPDALDELTHALTTRAMLDAPADRGELMLVLIDSGDLVEFEELDQSDAAHAQQRAIQTIELGHAARALVVRVIGEAKRQVEWKEAA